MWFLQFESLGAKDTTETAKYTATSTTTLSKLVAHINGEVVNVNEHLGYTGSVTATSTGYSVLSLTINGWALTEAPADADKQAAFEAYMASVDTCTEHENVADYIALAEGLNTSVTISDNGGDVTIAEKLAYMEYLNSQNNSTES